MAPSYYRVVSVRWDARERWDDPALLKQRRKRKGEKQERESRRHEVDLASREQRLAEREERWLLQKKEWDFRLKRLLVNFVQEVVLLVFSVIFAICALVLFIVAISHGGIYAASSSGLTGLASICGMVNLALMRSASSSPVVSPSE